MRRAGGAWARSSWLFTIVAITFPLIAVNFWSGVRQVKPLERASLRWRPEVAF